MIRLDTFPPIECAQCGCLEYAGAPECARCLALVDAVVQDGWRAYVQREFPGASEADEREIAGMVVQEPQRHEWRVYDAACDLLECPECGGRLGRGPVGCHPCGLADGNRYAAIEVDRPGVPPGNEHALRVNVAVVRCRAHALSAPELLGRRALLPMLIAGGLPATAEAQRASALLKRGATYEDVAWTGQ
ncbi:MAG TPA: hypothetical protein VF062_07935 [Candidatus Limnocylindrales bacterium]